MQIEVERVEDGLIVYFEETYLHILLFKTDNLELIINHYEGFTNQWQVYSYTSGLVSVGIAEVLV